MKIIQKVFRSFKLNLAITYIYIYIFHDIYTHIYFGNSLENKKVEFVEIRIQDTDIFLCKIFENLNIYIN